MAFLRVDPQLDALHSHPRFIRLLERVGPRLTGSDRCRRRGGRRSRRVCALDRGVGGCSREPYEDSRRPGSGRGDRPGARTGEAVRTAKSHGWAIVRAVRGCLLENNSRDERHWAPFLPCTLEVQRCMHPTPRSHGAARPRRCS
jgi:hypothetical protein